MLQITFSHQYRMLTYKTESMHSPQCVWSLQWRHNGCDGVSNHQLHHCLLNRTFRRRSKKISKLRVTGLCVGNPPVTGDFPAQRASDAENVSIWGHHVIVCDQTSLLNMKQAKTTVKPGLNKINNNYHQLAFWTYKHRSIHLRTKLWNLCPCRCIVTFLKKIFFSYFLGCIMIQYWFLRKRISVNRIWRKLLSGISFKFSS